MKKSRFLRVASICSILGAITTILLIYLPGAVASGIEEQAALYLNKLHMFKLWMLFLHPQFNFIAILGIAVLLIKKYPEYIIPGTFFLAIWAVTEMAQQAFMIDTVNQIWRPEYLNETDEGRKLMIENQLSMTGGIWDFMYFLIIFGFGLGTMLLGFAMIKVDKLAIGIGSAFIFIGILSLLSFLRYYAGLTFFSAGVDWVYFWIYPVLQPIVRIALGVWLWKQAVNK